MSRTWITTDEEETRALGEAIASEWGADQLCLLVGALGTGKTVFSQGLARALGVNPREVQSPSFTLVREHRGRAVDFIHIDLFRLEPDELAAVGVEEILAGDGVKVVEWAERLPPELCTTGTFYSFRRLENGSREIRELTPELAMR